MFWDKIRIIRKASMNDLKHVISEINKFREDRDWRQFHTPKSLSIALSVEASELLEFFQWIKDDDSTSLPEDKKDKLSQEIAYIAIYLLYLCDDLKIDLFESINNKISINNKKYPISKSKGTSKKYSDL